MMRDEFLLHALAFPTKTLNFTEIFSHNETEKIRNKMEKSSIRKLKILFTLYGYLESEMGIKLRYAAYIVAGTATVGKRSSF